MGFIRPHPATFSLHQWFLGPLGHLLDLSEPSEVLVEIVGLGLPLLGSLGLLAHVACAEIAQFLVACVPTANFLVALVPTALRHHSCFCNSMGSLFEGGRVSKASKDARRQLYLHVSIELVSVLVCAELCFVGTARFHAWLRFIGTARFHAWLVEVIQNSLRLNSTICLAIWICISVGASAHLCSLSLEGVVGDFQSYNSS